MKFLTVSGILQLYIFETLIGREVATKLSYDGYALYRVYTDTAAKLDFMEKMYEENFEDTEHNHTHLDFWNIPNSLDESVEVLVSPSMQPTFLNALQSRHMHFFILQDNIQKAIEEELAAVPPSHKSKRRTFKDGGSFDVSIYNPWSEIEKYLNKLPETYPSLVEVQVIGQSHEGRALTVVKVGNSKRDGSKKPAIWIDSGIHAREWISPATILYILDNLLYSYESSQPIKYYINEIDWYFLPVMNPDGYVHSFVKDRMWRKNRSPNNCTSAKKCCHGVDLNRNFGYHWGGSGASSGKCSNTYAGPQPFSEPEARAVRDFVLQHLDTLKGFFTYHSYAQSWRYPYGYKKNTFPEDVEELRALGKAAAQSVNAAHGVKYKVYTGGKSLSGVSRDWAKGEARIKYVFCIELASRGSGFVAPPRAITPSGEENWAGLTVVADKIIEKYTGANLSTPSTQPFTTPEEETTEDVTTTEIANTTSSRAVGGSTSLPCDDLTGDCSKYFGAHQCKQETVRVICRKFCNVCA